jgi:iron complex outermembrane recepter protein
MKFPGQDRLLAAALFGATALSSGVAFAQSAEVGELVVTAQRREQSAQDVGIAINAYGGEQLERLGVRNTADVAAFTPGVNISAAQGGTLQTFSIRGVTMGDYQPNQEGPNAVYFDEVYVSSLQGQGFGAFDTERVEILKGPQGTLFGRNATGGLVNYVSRKPTSEFSGYARATYGTRDQREIEGAVSGPLAEGLRARLAGMYRAVDPYLKNRIGPDYQDSESYAGRLHLEFEPNDRLRVLLSGRLGHEDHAVSGGNQFLGAIAIYDAAGTKVDARLLRPGETAISIVNGAPVGVRPTPGGDFFGYVDPDGPGRISDSRFQDGRVSATTSIGRRRDFSSLRGATLNARYELTDEITLSSITDYTRFKWRLSSALQGGVTAPGGFDTFTNGIDQYSQELRLNGDSETLHWVLGGYYLRIKSDNGSAFGFVFGPTSDLAFATTQKTKSASAFGQVEWEFAPGWSVIAGVRYIDESKDFTYAARITSPGPALVLRSFGPDTDPLASQDESLWSAKLGLNYQPTSDLLLYATWNRGVKAGGFNTTTDPTAPASAFVFDPEKLTAYETGFKSTLADGRLRFNGAAYYYDYANYQAFQSLGPGLNAILNAKSRVYGAELDLAARLAEGLDVALGASYLDALVRDVTVTPATPTNPAFIADRVPAFAPKWQLSAQARYEWPLSDGLRAALQADGSYRSDHFTQLNNFALLRQSGYALLNLRASLLDAKRRWRVEAAVRNVGDKIYKTTQFDISDAYGNTDVAYNTGRTFEITVGIDW